MRIAVWGINYAPELIGIAPCNVALCEYLVEKGCDVTMLTAFPYYPAWKKRAADARRIFQSERLNGVRVLRCWHYVPKRVSHGKADFARIKFCRSIISEAAIYSEARLADCRLAAIVGGCFGAVLLPGKSGKYLLHLQDLQPDAAINLGMVKSPVLIRALKTLESIAYRRRVADFGNKRRNVGHSAKTGRRGIQTETFPKRN